ncbi:hypothetical protein [Rathayibacter sp. VKM Ac-2760]|uniref:hypothetical protein n=1 Tax=Rathayibacter sp. VKM Ac-2760 TaxID=2609253 RepID=UPI001317AA49|nr:hypothetical protein [Rathayibacter sp. VKM Ac-2760]QHC60185.1 hypothetical protein GSU72_17735 [Rathayibacter sp. VKM Ac-2760]
MSRPRRRHFAAVVVVALVAGLVGVASSSAQAAAPSTGASEHPRLTVTTVGELLTAPGESVGVGTRVRLTRVLANTGDVPLTVSLGEFGRQDARIKLEGEYRLVSEARTVSEADLAAGFVRDSGVFTATTLQGARYTSPDVDYRLALPAPVEHPRLTVTPHVSLLLRDGEAVRVGTRISTTYTLWNTGDVPLHLSLAPFQQRDFLLPAGRGFEFTSELRSVTEAELAARFLRDPGVFTATTPSGASYTTPDIDYHFSLPAPADERHEL